MKECKIMLPEMSDYGGLAVVLGLLILLFRPAYITLGLGDPLYTCLIGIGLGLPWYFVWKKLEKNDVSGRKDVA